MSDDDSERTRADEVEQVDTDETGGFSSFDGSELADEEPSQGLFDDLLSGEPIFENKEVLRPSYTPHELPHRSDQINKMATILVAALRGETPSNILIYGKTGTGKTASAKFVSKELESTSQKYSVPCDVEYINCEVTDTQYRVLAQLANKFIEKNEARIDDRIDDLESLLEAVDEYEATSADADAAVRSEIEGDRVDEDDPFESVLPDDDESASTGTETGPASDESPLETEGSSNEAGGPSNAAIDDSDPTRRNDPNRLPADGDAQRPDDDFNREATDLDRSDTGSSDGRSDDGSPNHPLASTPFDSREGVEAEIESLEADKESFEEVPMTGWPTDRVYSVFFDAVDYDERVVVIMLDEIDKLVEKSGDDTLYNLSRMNSELENSRVSIIGISNDLKFTDFLDPRVKSSLGEEEIVFPPYDANQLRDILEHRSEVAFKGGALSEDVIPLCAAFAAQEHGDARRALDLLRTAGELAERSQAETIVEEHVREAQDKIELDRVVEVVRTLPTQSKLVLFAIILLEKNGVHSINTGEVFNIYKRLCEEIDADVLTQRRVTDLISELDMLGIVNAVVVSKGRYGRTKEISLSVPLEETEAVLLSDSRLSDIDDVQPFVQARFEN
ncbi:orc1/cdc6 family replication initiation protein [Haloterrigena turkmenica DSM 5511]|uniref:ORC1-type DNA replication protein n=1 Tax=Haloterrigena turkmenica (strain ATCC 51198 / DSM 5511 / JCM 9101 / NCIMB 13204 / VKM B-1734 / 4k) TaxID=543526 RepID=D2RSS8_HALTV|nr:ORC1-type DNA replication protein [Haloterrigena turkmenica]ADB58902.1 orc1/cdc6 family replication initiation protein [Haloterrigena turkmenica DSM 5511]